MNKYVFTLICAALLVSCAGTPSPAPANGSPASTKAATESPKAKSVKTVMVRVPKERKASVRFSDGSLDEYALSEYDASGLLSSRTRYSASGALLEKSVWSYVEGKTQTKSVTDSEEKLLSKTIYTWNAAGQLVGTSLEDGNGKRLSAYVYRFDKDGNRVEWVVQNGADKVMARTVYTFKDKKVIAAETQDGNGAKTGSASFEYDASGRLVVQKIFDAKGTLLRTENSLWKDKLLVEENQSDINGKVTFKITYEYGPDREIIKKAIDDITGKTSYFTNFEYTIREEQRTVEE